MTVNPNSAPRVAASRRETAQIMQLVTGSVGAVSIEERRHPSGALVTISVETSGDAVAEEGWCGNARHTHKAHTRRAGCFNFLPVQ